MKVSAVIITLNAAQSLELTLQALQWCDEIVIVDSGSSDSTLMIAEKYHCKIFHREFKGYGEQKRFAVDSAVNDWVLNVDADEVLSKELILEIQQKLTNLSLNEVAFTIPISLIFMQRKIRFGGEYGARHLRLFHRKFGNFNLNQVHEDVEIKGKIGQLHHHIWHYSYASIEEYFHKFNRYTTLGAIEAIKKNKKPAKWLIMIRLPFNFLQRYILQGLIFDGFPGFVWALFSSFYPVVKYIKLIEMLEKNNSPKENQ
jgi:glycosyltransferase involved in cell wall biosynthesis